jgi:CHC2 zinc finger
MAMEIKQATDKTTYLQSDEYFEWVDEVDKLWKLSNTKIPDKELLEIFPEAKGFIKPLLNELTKKQDALITKIRSDYEKIVDLDHESGEYILNEAIIKHFLGVELVELDKHIARLKRLQYIASGKVHKGSITQEQIDVAKSVPIEDVINSPLKRSGRNFVTLCPLHDEKTPSCHIYTETNRFWCFGCNKGGNPIDVLTIRDGLDFKTAVSQLSGVPV